MSRQALVLQKRPFAVVAGKGGLLGLSVVVLGVRLFLPAGGERLVAEVAAESELLGVGCLL